MIADGPAAENHDVNARLVSKGTNRFDARLDRAAGLLDGKRSSIDSDSHCPVYLL